MFEIDRRDRRWAFRLVAVQAAAVLLLSAAGSFFGVETALSLLAGGMVGVTGTAWLAFFSFRPSGTESAKAILASFYLGEIGKVLILAALFILVFQKLAWTREPRYALLVFSGFLVGQFTGVFATRLLK